jgi:uncharacterized protein
MLKAMNNLTFILLFLNVSLICSQNPINASCKNLPEGENIDYFLNGKIRAKVFIVNGNLQGNFISYYRNGQLKDSLQLQNGKFNGKNLCFNKYGDTTAIEIYHFDTLMFYCQKKYYSNHRIKLIHSAEVIDSFSTNILIYSNNSFLNEQVIFNVNKYLKKRCYREIKIVYFNNGSIRTEMNGINKLGKYSGIQKEYYKNNCINTECYYLDGSLHGIYIKYNNDGTIKKKQMYINGKKESSL